jgi:hypothetical protein
MILDYVLCAKPVFLEYVVAAYAVMSVPVIEEQNVATLLKKAEQMYLRDLRKGPLNDTPFVPLPHGHYPVLAIVHKAPMWREMELQRIREEADAVKQQMELQVQIEKETARIDRQRHKWMGERRFLSVVEDEQMAEFRRLQRETMMRENRKGKRAIAERRQAMMDRRVKELGAIGEWKRDCERVRDEVGQSLQATRDTWNNWVDRKEEEVAVEQEEMDMELELLRIRDEAQAEAMAAHGKVLDNAAQEESHILADAMAAHNRLEDEKVRMKEKLERERLRQGEDFRARQARRSGA